MSGAGLWGPLFREDWREGAMDFLVLLHPRYRSSHVVWLLVICFLYSPRRASLVL